MKSLSINKQTTLELSVPPQCCHPSLLKMNGSQAGQYAARWPKILAAVPTAGISSAFQTAADLCMINGEEQSAITHWPRPQMSNASQDSSCAYQNKNKAKLHWNRNFHLQEIIPLKATGKKTTWNAHLVRDSTLLNIIIPNTGIRCPLVHSHTIISLLTHY